MSPRRTLLAKIGDHCGFSRERARQVEAEALKRLRAMQKAKQVWLVIGAKQTERKKEVMGETTIEWTLEQLEAANGKYIYFSTTGRTCLIQKSGRGWIIGASRQTISTRVALQMLNYRQATLANESIHV